MKYFSFSDLCCNSCHFVHASWLLPTALTGGYSSRLVDYLVKPPLTSPSVWTITNFVIAPKTSKTFANDHCWNELIGMLPDLPLLLLPLLHLTLLTLGWMMLRHTLCWPKHSPEPPLNDMLQCQMVMLLALLSSLCLPLLVWSFFSFLYLQHFIWFLKTAMRHEIYPQDSKSVRSFDLLIRSSLSLVFKHKTRLPFETLKSLDCKCICV